MPPCGIFLVLIFIACSWYVTIRERDAWPFTRYPMFVNPVNAETLCVYRIAIGYADGSRRWWQPRFYKLQQTFGEEFARAIAHPMPERMARLQDVFSRIEHCLGQDPATALATSYCVVRRQAVRSAAGKWTPVDEVVQRVALRAVSV